MTVYAPFGMGLDFIQDTVNYFQVQNGLHPVFQIVNSMVNFMPGEDSLTRHVAAS